jgi:hypothetical protein
LKKLPKLRDKHKNTDQDVERTSRRMNTKKSTSIPFIFHMKSYSLHIPNCKKEKTENIVNIGEGRHPIHKRIEISRLTDIFS